ncbi:Oidioi.mRNA.OKI2018_I69.PAR.g9260.t1.cds [Oikopleura dioica]|uniref:Oidioi.mRNA.OKI2018_I69.PAR.g9260.t1.cds n=1 Tax=Oikopleura dioica TaxID=34765 RepID=A0ABN7RQP5_OIKDI|nr:Oidioi.mRNA.OKI2018_I69.PAR.g9260.t1.cds [Oikopleura dioica]
MTKIQGMIFSPVLEQAWKDIKAKKIKGFSMKLSEDLKSIEVDRTVGFEDNSWRELTDSLPESDVRYILYNFTYKRSIEYKVDNDCITHEKWAFLKWLPSGVPVKRKMMFSMASKPLNQDFFRTRFPWEFQCSDKDEISAESLTEELKKDKKYQQTVEIY